MERETIEDIQASCRELRRLRETFGPEPRAEWLPKSRRSQEDRDLARDDQENYQLDKLGYRS